MMLKRIADLIERRAGIFVDLSSYAALLAIGFLDRITGTEITFSLFYVFPVFLVAWYRGRRRGIAIALAAAGMWFLADYGTGIYYSHPLIPYWNAFLRLGVFLVVTWLAAALKQAMESQRNLARTDFLTGVSNSRSFFEKAEFELSRARRYSHTFAMLYVDLDNFKAVNDSLGHMTGDRLLRVVADTLRETVRETDIVARLGGDEFAVLLLEMDRKHASAVIEKIRKNLLDAMKRGAWPVTFSIGAELFIRPPVSVDDMIRKSDELMYAAKRAGKNRIKIEVSRG